MSDSTSIAPLEVTWDTGQRAAVTQCDGNHIVVQSEIAQAPGTPCAVTAADGARYEIKVRTCKRAGELPLPFRVEGRLFNLSGAKRTQLLARLSGNAAG